MLRNYLAAALRNLARNRLYAGITVAGLAIGFAAAMLIGLYVRDELTFNRFIPGYERTYRIAQTIQLGSSAPFHTIMTPMMLLEPLRLDFPEVEAAARISPAYFPPTLRRGDVVIGEQNFVWADPEIFQVLPLPVLAGRLRGALDSPDSLVMTQSAARKYFGEDAPVGKALLVDGQPMRVTAVLRDLPSNSDIPGEIFGSSRSARSTIAQFQAINSSMNNTLATYVRLRAGVRPTTIAPRLPAFAKAKLPIPGSIGLARRSLQLVPIGEMHLHPEIEGAFNTKPTVDPAVVLAIGATGVLIVIVAGINFVTLMTARASRRAVEVGVRKAAGARRGDLIVQFLGEALVYVLLAGALAIALAELLLPAFNLLLQRKLVFDYLGDPALAATILGVAVATGLLAGAYPAFVLSAFRPAATLKGGFVQASGGGGLRAALVTAQFAVLISLVVIAITIARQTLFALNEGMRVDKDHVALVFSQPCIEAMRAEAAKLPGVKSAACASATSLGLSDNHDGAVFGGRQIELANQTVDFGFLELFGVKPLAGRLFDRGRAADGPTPGQFGGQPIVINASAVRRLGLSSPQQAIGRIIQWHGIWDESLRQPTATTPPLLGSQVIGVVPDFTLGSVRRPIEPTIFVVGRNVPPDSVGLAVKMDGPRTPEALAGLDHLWKRLGGGRPMLRVFVDQFSLRLYIDTIVQGATIAVASMVALSIAALGLFALSAYTTERRTKEIGVRKAMGASTADILKLLLWEFSKPVLLANLIAWPAAWLVMDWWLKGFAYRVDQAPWTFAAAAAAAVLIAWGTVFVHALRVARARPVGALRYE
ncbi:MAG: transporter permease [Phenylobacterium sp.]|nr:transporter permease [Phenylobacterium sp.]